MTWTNSSPTSGTQDGSEAFCWVKIQSVITIPSAARTTIAIVSLLRPRDWRESEARKCRQRLTLGVSLMASPRGWAAPTWPRPALRSGTGLLSQRTSGFFGGRPPSCGWVPSGGAIVWA